jgi:hypothetical protein
MVVSPELRSDAHGITARLRPCPRWPNAADLAAARDVDADHVAEALQ